MSDDEEATEPKKNLLLKIANPTRKAAGRPSKKKRKFRGRRGG